MSLANPLKNLSVEELNYFTREWHLTVAEIQERRNQQPNETFHFLMIRERLLVQIVTLGIQPVSTVGRHNVEYYSGIIAQNDLTWYQRWLAGFLN